MTKRIFALLLALVLVVGLLPMGTLAAETSSAWDGTTVTEPKKVDGVYQIGTAEELAWFGQQSRKYGAANRTMQAKLTADIDLNNQDWAAYSIGDSGSYAYAGTFDGDGHTVKGYRIYKNYTKNPSLYAYLAFFGCTSKATIRNLTLEGSVEIDMNGATERVYKGYAAGLVAEAKGTTIQNVVVDVDISLTNNDSKYGAITTGGVAARVSFVSENGATTSDPKVITNSLIENCENRGNVFGGGSVGGIAGRTANCVTVRNCKNSGDISSVTTYAGGIVGDIAGTTVEGCANTGSISGGYNAAGIAGNVAASHSTNAENPGTWVAVIRNCYNTGDVVCQGYSTSMDWYAAGIAGKSSGYIDLSNRDNNQYNIIENCYTTGKVTLGQESAKLHAAGFVGAASYTNVANCYYLEGTAEVGSTDSTAAKNIVMKTEAEMKSKDFAAALGDAYKVRSKDFPALTWEKASGSVDVAVTANAEHALIRILDAEQNEVAPNEDGTYTLETGKTYTYTARAAGYVTATGTIDDVASAADEGFVITMAKSADYPKNLDAQWPSFRGNDENMAVVDYPTPTSADDSELLWAAKLGTSWAAAPGSPIMVDGYIYVQAGKQIMKLDRNTGSVAAQGTMVESSGFSVVPPTYGAGMIFVPQGSGRVQAFNAETLESLWTYKDPLGGQSLSAITYADGYVYVGFWNSEEKNANFVCLTVDDEDPGKTDEAKTALWTYTQKGGFYWAGAYVHGDYVLVGTDDGQSGNTSATANLLVFNRYNGKLVDSKTGYVGDIRSNVAYDADSDRIYFTTKGGYLYSEKIDWTTGKILEESQSVELGSMSTSTPVVYNGRAYVGVAVGGNFGGSYYVAVVDLDTWTIAYKAYMNGYPQTSGLVSAGQDADGYAYVYFCANNTPGGIFVIKDKPGVTEVLDGTEKDGKMYAPLVFNPESPLSQYCICSPIADEYGTLYYKNDSCYIMAVSSKITGLTVEAHEAAVDGKYDDSKIEAYAELANGLHRPVSVTSSQDENGEWIASYTYGLAAGSYSKTTLTAPLHNFTGWQIQTEPTCDAEGLMIMKCEDCGETKTRVMPALGHDWDEGQVTKAATCTAEGEMTYTCRREGCQETKIEAIAKIPHTYESVVTAPTCEGVGYTTYTCSVCGDSYVDDIVEALGHSYEDVVTAPTCDKMGYTTHTCKTCGLAYVDTFTDALNHDFVKTVTKEPTCTEEGEMTFTCAHEGCEETYTQPIPKADHDLEETKVEAACETAGYTTYSCKNCDYTYIAELVQPLGHDWDEGQTLLAANCIHEGMVKYTCSVCGETKIETLEITDHVWDEGQVTKEPTAYAEGEKTYTCTVCGETRTEAIAKLGTCDGGKTCPSAKFTDVSASQWYHEAVDYAVVNGLFAGTSDTTFSPNETMTRGMLVTVLWRMAGKPEAKAASSFQDVDADQYYAVAVAWAAENGIVAGTSKTTFTPNAKVTREQMAAILYRYAKFSGADVTKTADLTSFPDADKVSAYAEEALAWAVENGLVSGTLKGGKAYLDPTGNATRAQVASILMRYAKTFA